MRREWVYFDFETIRAEFEALPEKDEGKLLALMEFYQTAGLNNPSPVQIDDYGDGIKRLRHIKSAYSGRALFFAVDRMAGFERLVVLTVYQKQSNSVPKNILERARSRMAEYKKRRDSIG